MAPGGGIHRGTWAVVGGGRDSGSRLDRFLSGRDEGVSQVFSPGRHVDCEIDPRKLVGRGVLRCGSDGFTGVCVEPTRSSNRSAGIRAGAELFLYYCRIGATADDALQSGSAASPVVNADAQLAAFANMDPDGIGSISGMAICGRRGIADVSAALGFPSHCPAALRIAPVDPLPVVLADVHALASRSTGLGNFPVGQH